MLLFRFYSASFRHCTPSFIPSFRNREYETIHPHIENQCLCFVSLLLHFHPLLVFLLPLSLSSPPSLPVLILTLHLTFRAEDPMCCCWPLPPPASVRLHPCMSVKSVDSVDWLRPAALLLNWVWHQIDILVVAYQVLDTFNRILIRSIAMQHDDKLFCSS